jgi:hypothetical protein
VPLEVMGLGGLEVSHSCPAQPVSCQARSLRIPPYASPPARRPHTLRARFGASRVRNAVHCTDLEEDGSLESSYFFNVLQAAH